MKLVKFLKHVSQQFAFWQSIVSHVQKSICQRATPFCQSYFTITSFLYNCPFQQSSSSSTTSKFSAVLIRFHLLLWRISYRWRDLPPNTTMALCWENTNVKEVPYTVYTPKK